MTSSNDTLTHTGAHVVMLVSNPCDPDFRVTKEAESLVKAGYRVTILCTWRAESPVPVEDEINGVRYLRRFWDAADVLRRLVGRGRPDPTRQTQVAETPPQQAAAVPKRASAPSPTKAWLRKWARRGLSKGYAYIAHWTYTRTFAEALRAQKPDIIHAHDGVTLPCAAKVARQTGAKLVFDSHELETHRNPPLSPLRRAHVRYLERRYLPRADKVITVGERIADHLAADYPIDRPTVILNAPPSVPGPVPARWDVPDRRDIRRDAGLTAESFIFAYTGNITLNRGLEIGLQAMTRLQSFVPNSGGARFDLVAVGRCFEDQEAILRKMARTLGLQDRFHILPPVAAHRVPGYISAADVSLIPILPMALSYELAMPNKLFEATLSGNPILGSNLTEMGAMIRKERLGLTFDPSDPDDCAEKMLELVRRFPDFKRDADRQSELTAQYAWEAQEQRLIDTYSDMLRTG